MDAVRGRDRVVELVGDADEDRGVRALQVHALPALCGHADALGGLARTPGVEAALGLVGVEPAVPALTVKLERMTGIPRGWFLGWDPSEYHICGWPCRDRTDDIHGVKVTECRPPLISCVTYVA
ncbi:MAG: hypothetical protein LBE05_00020 [Microbacterium sp.]|nr:hypothetical protein [Microbacterium sp.]